MPGISRIALVRSAQFAEADGTGNQPPCLRLIKGYDACC
jgi:hypothetical protein